MKNTTFNDELKVGYPEGFHIMDEEELSAMSFTEKGPTLCLKDPARHMIVSIGRKDIPGFSALMLNRKNIAINAEEYVRKANSNFGYRPGEFFERNIGNDNAYGFSYSYEAQGIPMYAECFAVKKKNKIYYYNLYIREEEKEKNLQVWDEMLSSVSDCMD